MTKNVYTGAGRILEKGAEGLLVKSIAPLGHFSRGVAVFHDKGLRAMGEGVSKVTVRLREGAYNAWQNGIIIGLRRTCFFFQGLGNLLIKVDYNPKGERFFQIFNIMNFDFDVVLIITILLLMLAAGIFLL